MGLIGKLGGSLTQGILGNMNEKDTEELQKKYGDFLLDGETIQIGFQLVRDVMIITDRRLLDFDKQGATGAKMRVKSIMLDSIIDVTAETAGFGFDDSEIGITYITSPYYRAGGGVTTDCKTYEFPKKYNIGNLYRMLQSVAYENLQKINA